MKYLSNHYGAKHNFHYFFCEKKKKYFNIFHFGHFFFVHFEKFRRDFFFTTEKIINKYFGYIIQQFIYKNILKIIILLYVI